MSFDVDAFLAERAKFDRDWELKEWGALCPDCGADVLDELRESAHDWDGCGYDLPASTEFECPGCEKELTFDLEWSEPALWRASLATPEKAAV